MPSNTRQDEKIFGLIIRELLNVLAEIECDQSAAVTWIDRATLLASLMPNPEIVSTSWGSKQDTMADAASKACRSVTSPAAGSIAQRKRFAKAMNVKYLVQR